MVRRREVGCVVALVLMLGACTTEPEPIAELKAAIAAYEQRAADGTDERVKAAFAKVDAQVARVRADELAQPAERRAELTRQRETLETERQAQVGAYMKAKVARIGGAATDAMRQVGQQLGQELEAAGKRLRETMQPDTPGKSPDGPVGE